MSKQTFFDAHQRATVEAAMARIIPTDHEPGAREAGTIDFVDRYLSGIEFIYAKPDGSGFETLTGKRAEAWRQRVEILRKTYVDGIAALDALSRETFGAEFKTLDERRQDEALLRLARKEAQRERRARTRGRRFSRRSPRPSSASCRCSRCTRGRASTPIRFMAATRARSAGK